MLIDASLYGNVQTEPRQRSAQVLKTASSQSSHPRPTLAEHSEGSALAASRRGRPTKLKAWISRRGPLKLCRSARYRTRNDSKVVRSVNISLFWVGVALLFLPSVGLTSSELSVSSSNTAYENPRDLLIQGGLVVDGTGSAPEPADVLVRGGKIQAVAPHGLLKATPRQRHRRSPCALVAMVFPVTRPASPRCTTCPISRVRTPSTLRQR